MGGGGGYWGDLQSAHVHPELGQCESSCVLARSFVLTIPSNCTARRLSFQSSAGARASCSGSSSARATSRSSWSGRVAARRRRAGRGMCRRGGRRGRGRQGYGLRGCSQGREARGGRQHRKVARGKKLLGAACDEGGGDVADCEAR